MPSFPPLHPHNQLHPNTPVSNFCANPPYQTKAPRTTLPSPTTKTHTTPQSQKTWLTGYPAQSLLQNLPPRPQNHPSHPHPTTPASPHPRSLPIPIHTDAVAKPETSILRPKHPLPGHIHHSAETIANYGHTSSETRSREQTIARLEAQITSNRAPACWVESIGAGMVEEGLKRWREVYRSRDVLEVERGTDKLWLAQRAWEEKVRAKAMERMGRWRGKERRERELEGEEDSEDNERRGREARVRWKEKGKGKGRKECDSFKAKWRDLIARMEEEDKGKEAVGEGGGFSVQ